MSNTLITSASAHILLELAPLLTTYLQLPSIEYLVLPTNKAANTKAYNPLSDKTIIITRSIQRRP